MSDFPKTTRRFIAYRDDGSEIYAGELREDRSLDFYSDGHPFVGKLRVATYALESIEEVPVDASAESRAAWTGKRG